MSEVSDEGLWPDDTLWNEANLALGRFLTAWGAIENVIAALFRDFGIPDRAVASIVLGELATKAQIKIVTAMIKRRPSNAELDALLKAIDQVGAANQRRNAIVHAHWSLMTPPPVLYRVAQSVTDDEMSLLIAGIKGRHEGQKIRDTRGLTVAKINKEIVRLRKLHQALLASRDLALRSPSPDTPS